MGSSHPGPRIHGFRCPLFYLYCMFTSPLPLPLGRLVLRIRVWVGVGQDNRWRDSGVGLTVFFNGVGDLDGPWFCYTLFLMYSIYKSAVMDARGFVWSLVNHDGGNYFGGEHLVGYVFFNEEAVGGGIYIYIYIYTLVQTIMMIYSPQSYCWWCGFHECCDCLIWKRVFATSFKQNMFERNDKECSINLCDVDPYLS